MSNHFLFMMLGIIACLALVFCLIMIGCRNSGAKKEAAHLLSEEQPSKETLTALFDVKNGFPQSLSNSWKIWGHHNALFTHHFGADPTAMVYEGRVYLYTSNDTLLYDAKGNVKGNEYGDGIQGIHISSSADLVNWTDHGVINLAGIPSTNPLQPSQQKQITYASATWAPSITWKIINGKPKFFLYWCNTGNGIGVFTADSPAGPWTSPLNRLLIDRNTPNCASVIWLFDPGVFTDDDGQAYLFFGGGVNSSVPADNTGQARRVRLGGDMLSITGTPETFNVPYLFEAMEMFKYKNKYYLTYCTNWSTEGNPYGFGNSEIAYMTADNPMGEFSEPRGILLSASRQLNSGDSNNHQGFFIFNDQLYIVYHTQKPAQAMGLPDGLNYRTASVDKVTVNTDGSVPPITMTRKGVEQAGTLNPFELNEAETIGIQGGVYTRPDPDAGGGMVVTSIDSGDWIGVYGVNFDTGAKKFSARVRTPETPADYAGAIELRIDPTAEGITGDNGNLSGTATTRIKGGEVIGRVLIKAGPGEAGKYADIRIDLEKTVTGVHDLVFIFYSSLGAKPETLSPDSRHKKGFEFDQWQFFRE